MRRRSDLTQAVIAARNRLRSGGARKHIPEPALFDVLRPASASIYYRVSAARSEVAMMP